MVGIFPSYGAKAIYDKFCPENGIAIDFAAGFGSRLMGAYCSQNVKEYICCEPNVKTYRGLMKIYKSLQHYLPIAKIITVQNNAAENFLSRFADGVADLVFTSPPYFDTEHYDENNISQSSVSYSNYGEWFSQWLCWCIKESIRVLKTSGIFVLNVANCNPYMIADDVRRYLQQESMLFSEMELFLSAQKSEPLFIMRK